MSTENLPEIAVVAWVALALFVPWEKLVGILIGFCGVWVVGYGAWWAASSVALWAWGLFVAAWPLLLVAALVCGAYLLLRDGPSEERKNRETGEGR